MKAATFIRPNRVFSLFDDGRMSHCAHTQIHCCWYAWCLQQNNNTTMTKAVHEHERNQSHPKRSDGPWWTKGGEGSAHKSMRKHPHHMQSKHTHDMCVPVGQRQAQMAWVGSPEVVVIYKKTNQCSMFRLYSWYRCKQRNRQLEANPHLKGQ